MSSCIQRRPASGPSMLSFAFRSTAVSILACEMENARLPCPLSTHQVHRLPAHPKSIARCPYHNPFPPSPFPPPHKQMSISCVKSAIRWHEGSAHNLDKLSLNDFLLYEIEIECSCPIQVAGILLGDAAQLGRALNSDVIVEPVRGPLIPGFTAVKEAALSAGLSLFLTASRLSCTVTSWLLV